MEESTKFNAFIWGSERDAKGIAPLLTLHWLWIITQQNILKYLLERCHICFLVEYQSLRISDNRPQSENKLAHSLIWTILFFYSRLLFLFSALQTQKFVFSSGRNNFSYCKQENCTILVQHEAAIWLLASECKSPKKLSKQTCTTKTECFLCCVSTGCICTLVLYAVIKRSVCSAPPTLAKINKCLKGLRFFQ